MNLTTRAAIGALWATLAACGGAAAGKKAPAEPAVDPLSGAPELGSCYSGVQQLGQALSATKGECADDSWFTFAVGELAESTSDITTDAVDADTTVRGTCTAATLRGYDADTGSTRPKGSYDLFVLPPSSTAYLQGQRWFACLARLTS